MDKKKLNTGEIISAIAKKNNIPSRIVHTVISDFVMTVNDTIAEGGEIRIRDLGSFTSRKRPERTYNDMRTGEKKISAAHTVPVFRASKRLGESAAKLD